MHLRVRQVVLGMVAALALAALASAQGASAPAALELVLSQMDAAAKDFHTLQASFVWDQRTVAPVEDEDVSKGTIYFQRDSKQVKMSADITTVNGEPAPKTVLFADGEVNMYTPKTDQVTRYKTGKHQGEVESFLLLGFGGRGHDLSKSYDVKYLGEEKVDGVDTGKLELVPKSEKARNQFPRILLWIDPGHGILVQQQLFQPDGNYRLAKYSKILINQKLPDGVFKLKTTPKTTYLAPQG
jgi:outer membrane lipoprotein-sorting protein